LVDDIADVSAKTEVHRASDIDRNTHRLGRA
jgi:hypothetical protein